MVQLRNLFNKSSPLTPTVMQPRGGPEGGAEEDDDEDNVTLLTGSELAWSFAEALLHDLALNTPLAGKDEHAIPLTFSSFFNAFSRSFSVNRSVRPSVRHTRVEFFKK